MNSNLPRGKGLVLSTADFCAAIAAYVTEEGIDLSDSDIAKLWCEVEPSDCTLKHGALGVNCAHSGSVLGVLFEEGDHAGGVSTCEMLTEAISRHLGDSVSTLGCHRVLSEGCHV